MSVSGKPLAMTCPFLVMLEAVRPKHLGRGERPARQILRPPEFTLSEANVAGFRMTTGTPREKIFFRNIAVTLP